MSNINKIREMTTPTTNSPKIKQLIDAKYDEIVAAAAPFRVKTVPWARYVVRMDFGYFAADDDVPAPKTDIRAVHDGSTGLPFLPGGAVLGPDATRASTLTREFPRNNEIRVLVSHLRGESLFFVEE